MRKFLLGMMAAVLLFSTGCGTLFFTHRVGKKASKKVDNKVFVTNCFLCLFGIIPGVVAFILDYDNGTIYYTEAELIPDEDLYGQLRSREMKKVSCPDMEFGSVALLLSERSGKNIAASEIRLALHRTAAMSERGTL